MHDRADRNGFIPEVDEYVESMPPTRVGYWQECDDGPATTPCRSLEFARSVQSMMQGKDLGAQELLIAQNFDMLDSLAIDVKDKRAALKMHDDSWLSSNIGGYSIVGNSRRLITLRLYELAYGLDFKADYDDNGRRKAGPVYAPVLAVQGLSLMIARS